MTSHRWRVEGVLFVFSCFFSVSAREEKFSSNSAPGHAGDMEVAVLEKKKYFSRGNQASDTPKASDKEKTGNRSINLTTDQA